MEFSWTTFLLEIINFLILVWILKRFLYKPILDAIGRRQAAVEKTLSDANTVQADAQRLKQEYENRIAVWNQEKEQARLRMLHEIDVERTRLLDDAKVAADEERERKRVLEERREDEIRHRMEEDAFAVGKAFTSKLLSRLSGPDLEARLLALVIEDLPRFPEEQRRSIRSSAVEMDSKILVTSRFLLKEDQRTSLETVLNHFLGRKGSYDYAQDASLLAGLRITVGPWVLRANLADEMGFFFERVRDVH